MTDPLFKIVRSFLDKHYVKEKPLLLGYSGGPDSQAMLHLLLACRKFYPIEIHLAHVDHGWRSESGQEAEWLKSQAERFHLPWHLCTLTPDDFTEGNWEEQGRNKRLSFFASLYKKLDCQALLLGHHADDQAEIVLKRIFEGASLYSLRGLSGKTQYKEMCVWRPLLKISKKDLLAWIQGQGEFFLLDPTNQSTQFLRGKMRTTLLPFLNETFGKEISENLCLLGEEACAIRSFFSQLNAPLFERIEKKEALLSSSVEEESLKMVDQMGECSPLAIHCLEGDFRKVLPLPPLQLKFLLKEWLSPYHFSLSREILDGIAKSLLEKEEKKDFKTKKVVFSVFRKKISAFFVRCN